MTRRPTITTLYIRTVLFDVVKIYRGGRRRLRAEVLAEMPLRGDVRIDDGGIHGLTATLVRADMPDSRPAWVLHSVRTGRMRGNHWLLTGIEEAPDPTGYLMRERQTWWCRRPGSGGPMPFDPEPPSAVPRDPTYA